MYVFIGYSIVCLQLCQSNGWDLYSSLVEIWSGKLAVSLEVWTHKVLHFLFQTPVVPHSACKKLTNFSEFSSGVCSSLQSHSEMGISLNFYRSGIIDLHACLLKENTLSLFHFLYIYYITQQLPTALHWLHSWRPYNKKEEQPFEYKRTADEMATHSAKRLLSNTVENLTVKFFPGISFSQLNENSYGKFYLSFDWTIMCNFHSLASITRHKCRHTSSWPLVCCQGMRQWPVFLCRWCCTSQLCSFPAGWRPQLSWLLPR